MTYRHGKTFRDHELEVLNGGLAMTDRYERIRAALNGGGE